MADAKRARKKQSRQARLAAEAAARRKAAQRRRLMFLAGGAVLLAIILAVVTSGDGKKTDVATTGSSTTQVPTPGTAAGSAAGKPCVALADPLPAGAPEVPVKVGPPPAELVKEDLKPGTGAEVKAGQTLTVNYIGVSCSTGKIFDSSYSRGQAATFPLSGVIKGWQDGIPGMKVGGQRLLGIPSAQAYGETGSPPSIAPDEPLWFVVDVLDAK